MCCWKRRRQGVLSPVVGDGAEVCARASRPRPLQEAQVQRGRADQRCQSQWTSSGWSLCRSAIRQNWTGNWFFKHSRCYLRDNVISQIILLVMGFYLSSMEKWIRIMLSVFLCSNVIKITIFHWISTNKWNIIPWRLKKHYKKWFFNNIWYLLLTKIKPIILTWIWKTLKMSKPRF